MGAPSRLLALLLYTLHFLPLVLATGIQYCRDELPLCFGVASTKNETAGGHDIHLSLVATPSKNGGWVAVGIGKKMAGSLIFVMYSDQDRTSPVTSIRTVESHTNPTVLTDHATYVEVLNSSISATSYHAHFVCYSCELWWQTPIVTKGKTPFIYSANRDQTFDPPETDSVLMMHDYYGVVEGDMDEALLSDADEYTPAIRPGETTGFVMLNENGHANLNPKAGSLLSSSWLSPAAVHGVVMSVAFMGLFMLGGILIQLPLARAFKYHWAIQIGALLLALGSATYMTIRSTHFDLHKILGLTVVSALAIQAVVGYKHHTVFIQIHQQSVFTSIHRWLGRGLLLLGTVNVALGLYHRGRPTGAIVAWFVIWLTEVAGYVWILRRKNRHQRQQRGHMVPKSEHDTELFGLAGDNSDDSEDSDFEEEV
ncbi:uncharacterized protein N7443_006967 [Penicillium atrosanguineum]|uniref:uncharacterized protein n=1 Tax=Penicillium atrosanguineum TaxID=1132637 RepID=UPI0023A48D33|nr:uncharacterized protein N7443_006967 [Penicillium atrosanguineum]KAJ5298847.1 hypothetical protein N7443_006967 [Penicillium atrosanguineum]